MNYYIKTECDDKTLLTKLRYYISIGKKYIVIDNKLKNVLEKTYKLTVDDIIKYLYKDIRIKEVEPLLHQIYILDESINNKIHLKQALQLLEYGDVDIQPERVVSRLIQRCINQIKGDLGG